MVKETIKEFLKPAITKIMLCLILLSMIIVSGCANEKIAKYTSGKIEEPQLSYNPPIYSFTQKQYNNSEYDLPLTELPENYQRDLVRKFRVDLNEKQKQQLLENGIVIISGQEEKFEQAYKKLSDVSDRYREGVPVFVTTDSIMHLFHIEFNELLKNVEINKLTPMLDEFLEKTVDESIAQYNGLDDEELKELSRRNVAYLSVAKKLLDPDFKVPRMVKSEVNQEIKRIEAHKGVFKNELFSKDCPKVCSDRLYPSQMDYA